MLMIKTRLRQLREELTNPKMSQEAIARKAGVSLQWYRLLETGQQTNTSLTTAKALLNAFNTERLSRSQTTLTIDQLDLNIV